MTAGQIPTLVLSSLLGLALLAFLVMSAILVYHWRHYGMKSSTVYLAEGMYFSVSGCLITFAIIFYLVLL